MDLRRFLSLNLEVIPERCHGDEVVFVCGTDGCTDQTGNRSINVKTLKTSCWKCGNGGDALKWLRKKGLDPSEVTLGTQKTDLNDFLEDTNERIFLPFTEVRLPEGFTPLPKKIEGYYPKAIAAMALRKHLTYEDLRKAGVGYTRGQVGKSYQWEPYAIFPVVEWDKIVYYQGRTYIDVEGESTKKFPSKADLPYGSRYWLYNIDKARKATAQKPLGLILVESILNVLSLEKELASRGIFDFVPIALFKHKLSPEQDRKIRLLRHIKEVCLIFDNDAIEAARNTAKKLQDFFPAVTVVHMPEEVDANDDAKKAVDLFLRRKSHPIENPLFSLLDHAKRTHQSFRR